MIRLRAIRSALFYGLAPSRLYERQCHYAPDAPFAYFKHAARNLRYALDWAVFRETDFHRHFERENNANPAPLP